MHLFNLIHEFHNLSWIIEMNELLHDILIYWDAPVFDKKYSGEKRSDIVEFYFWTFLQAKYHKDFDGVSVCKELLRECTRHGLRWHLTMRRWGTAPQGGHQYIMEMIGDLVSLWVSSLMWDAHTW